MGGKTVFQLSAIQLLLMPVCLVWLQLENTDAHFSVYSYTHIQMWGKGGGVVTGVGLMSLFCHLTSREKKQVLTRLSTSP